MLANVRAAAPLLEAEHFQSDELTHGEKAMVSKSPPGRVHGFINNSGTFETCSIKLIYDFSVYFHIFRLYRHW